MSDLLMFFLNVARRLQDMTNEIIEKNPNMQFNPNTPFGTQNMQNMLQEIEASEKTISDLEHQVGIVDKPHIDVLISLG